MNLSLRRIIMTIECRNTFPRFDKPILSVLRGVVASVCVRPLLLASGRGLRELCRGRRPRRPEKRAVGAHFRSIRESPLRRKRQFTAFSGSSCQGQPPSQGALNGTKLFRFAHFYLNATAPSLDIHCNGYSQIFFENLLPNRVFKHYFDEL